MKKRRLVIAILALVVVFGSVSVASAYTTFATVSTNRTSNTSATVVGLVDHTTTVKTATIKLTLQEKYNGSWRIATGVPVRTVSQTKSNTAGFTLPYNFTLKKGKVYRIKGVFISKKNTETKTNTVYSGAF